MKSFETCLALVLIILRFKFTFCEDDGFNNKVNMEIKSGTNSGFVLIIINTVLLCVLLVLIMSLIIYGFFKRQVNGY